MLLLVLILTLFVFLAAGVPVAFALLLSAVPVLLWLGIPLQVVITQTYSSVDSFTLLAIPFFMFLGRLLNAAQLTDRIVSFAHTLVGHIRGGLGHINIAVSMMFGALSGSSHADTASVGSVMIPAMVKAGYPPAYSAAITAASSIIGGVIPPSILMIIYGSFAQISIGALFLAGIIPGLLIGLSQMLLNYVVALREGYPAERRASLREVGRAGLASSPALVIPVLILGGISTGLFSATEAASITVLYTTLLIAFWVRSMSFRDYMRELGQAAVEFSLPLFAIACSGIFGWLIAFLQGPQIIEALVVSITTNYYLVALMLIAFLLLIGTFMSGIAAIIIFLPVIQQVGAVAGIDPIVLGMTTIIAISTGLLTPPYGISIFIAAQIADMRPGPVFRAVLPLVGLLILLVILGIVFPQIYLFLPNLLMKG